MHGLIWFLPDFRDWPLAVARGLQVRAPDWTFCGIVSGFARDHAYVESSSTPSIQPLYFFDDLQQDWLSRPAASGSITKYENILGSQVLNRILIADRNVGRGFITGVDMPETPLMRNTTEHENRLRYLVGLLDFLFEVFQHEKPDFVFAPGVAGALAMALASVCQHFNVEFRSLLSTRIGTRHTITSSTVGLSPSIEERFRRACQEPRVVEKWRDEAHAIIAAFHDRPQGLIDTATSWQRATRPLRPIDMLALAWRTARRRQPELINLPYPSNYFGWEIKRRLRIYRMSRSRLFNDLSALEGKQFAYFPLHRTPEASTMVLAPLLTDQIPIIESLAKCLPMETYLAVKEHVPMIGRRPADFYRRLAAIPKVVLIPAFADSFELIRRAELTCVITGTAGWEAILMKRPTLCLGRALYQTLGEGFVRCDELSRLPDAIAEALVVPPASDEKIAIYIASVLAESFDLPKQLRFSVPADIVAAHPEISDAMVDRLLQSLNPAFDIEANQARKTSIA